MCASESLTFWSHVDFNLGRKLGLSCAILEPSWAEVGVSLLAEIDPMSGQCCGHVGSKRPILAVVWVALGMVCDPRLKKSLECSRPIPCLGPRSLTVFVSCCLFKFEVCQIKKTVRVKRRIAVCVSGSSARPIRWDVWTARIHDWKNQGAVGCETRTCVGVAMSWHLSSLLFSVCRESCKKALNFSVVAGPGLTWNRARLLQMGLSLWWLSGCDGFSILCAFLCSTRPGTTSHCAAPAVMKTPRYWPRGCDHLAQPGMAAKLRGNRLQKRPPSARLRGELCGWTSWCKDFAMPSLMPRAVSSLIPACRGGCQRVSWAGPGKNCAACGRTCDFLKFDMEATLQ